MDRNKHVMQLIKKQSDFYKENVGWLFPSKTKESELWQETKEELEEMLEEDDPVLADINLMDFSDWYLRYSQYVWVEVIDKKLQKKAFSHGSWCGYKSIKVRAEVGRIKKQINISFSSGKLLYCWSNLLLSGWYEEAAEVMKLALASTKDSDDHGIMGEGGYSLDAFSFFLMELYCLWQKKSFYRNNFRHPLIAHPDTPFIYDEVLINWGTKDLQQVDDLVSIMADYHLSRTTEQDEDTDEEDEDHFEFSDSDYRLYPFEILAWLKIRSLSGLPNPDQYTHPLMNQPLAEPITDTPLPRPTNHKETNQILDLVCKHYPTARL